MEKLNVKLKSLDDKVMFGATARSNPQVVIDYFPPVGTGQGYTSLELLMASFGSCISTALLTLLRYRLQKTVKGISVEMEGEVSENHPKKLDRIHTVLHIESGATTDLTDQQVQQMLKVAEDSICPVWAMLKGNVEIDITTIIAGE